MIDIVQRADELLQRSEELLEEAVGLSPHRKAAIPVAIQHTSCNRKLSPQNVIDVRGRERCVPIGPFCSSTYVSIESTCPRSCPYRGHGCYAQGGMAVRRLDRVAVRAKWSGLATIEAESQQLDRLFVRGVRRDGARGGRDLRLHVSGDTFSTRGARILADAARRWQERGGGAVWTFTHLWRSISRRDWGRISVLASVETLRGAREAFEHGYAPALTLPEHQDHSAFPVGAGLKIVPCPAQTVGTTCVQCRLCLDGVEPGRGVAFALHGTGLKRARRRLKILQEIP